MKIVEGFSVALLFLFLALNVSAEVKLPALFSENMVLQQNTEVAVWGWAKPQTKVIATNSWGSRASEVTSDKNGKWKLKMETPAAGGPYEITISDGEVKTIKNVMIGEVWLCSGQSNMEMPMKGFTGQPVAGSNMDILKSKNKNIHFISVSRATKNELKDDFDGQWQEASPQTVVDFSATAYYFARLMNEMLDVPIGLINVSYGGSCIQAWMSKETAIAYEDKQIPKLGDSVPVPNRTPTVLFNGMLNPVIGYGIKGCIWYQGETNYKEPNRYESLFPTMVEEWRKLWGIGDFPFYYAQIAPYNYTPNTDSIIYKKNNSAYLRDVQRKSMGKIPNSGMAVLMDIGEKDCIHPTDKKTGGERLALWALAEAYGLKGFAYKSPSFSEYEVKGSTMTISFNDVPNGLTSFGKELTQFEIAGEDKKFYPATVFVRRKSVISSSPRVEKPVAVRYAFKDFVVGDLFGTEGLPVSSFRTDNW